LSKQRVYSAEGTPLNFLDTNRSWRQAAMRYSKERERVFSIIKYTSYYRLLVDDDRFCTSPRDA